MFYFKRSEKGRHLLVRLYTIAEETHSCILLTRTRAWTQDIPDLVDVERIRPALAQPFLDVLEEKPKFFFNQTKKTFHLAPEARQVRGEGNDLRIEYPDGCKKITRPPKKAPKDRPMPEFLKEVIWNLNNLAKSPPITPKVTGPLKYAQPEWKAKLEDIPTLYKTPHGVVFIAWRFKEYIENLFSILRQETTPRDFDLVRWYDGNYKIYNSRVKLSELLELGGIEKGEGFYRGRSLEFESSSENFMPFDEFIQYLVDYPLEFQPFPL